MYATFLLDGNIRILAQQSKQLKIIQKEGDNNLYARITYANIVIEGYGADFLFLYTIYYEIFTMKLKQSIEKRSVEIRKSYTGFCSEIKITP